MKKCKEMSIALAGFACLIGGSAIVTPAQARDFTYAGWGGTLQDAQREVYLKKLSKQFGFPVKEDVYLGGWAKFETMQKSKDINWDVVNVESQELLRGCDEGVFVKLDYDRIGVARNAFVKGAATDCGIGSYVWAYALAYNSKTTNPAPTSLTDLWDTKKWPGKRGMRKLPRFNLELALLADGVKPADVYKTLATPEGVDRAFKKLDEIKPDVLWWTAPAQAVDLLNSGEVAMTIAPNARISDAAKAGKPFKMVFKPGAVGTDFWVILEGTPKLDQAYDFMKVATNVDNQVAFSEAFAYAPTVAAAESKLPAAAVESLPIGEAVSDDLDLSGPEATQFWADYGDKINERWNAWLAE